MEGRTGKSLLLLSQFVWVGGILLRLFYSGSVQSGILYDYFSDIFDPRVIHEDGKRLVFQVLRRWSHWRFWDLFLDAFKGDVCCGCKAASLFELDISLKMNWIFTVNV